MNGQDAVVAVIKRNIFYKKLHYLALCAFALMILTIGVLIFVAIYLSHNPSIPLYFATDKVGRLIPIVPVSEPGMTQGDLTNWVIEALESAYSYDYVNYRLDLQGSQKYFTAYGWEQYMNALTASNNLVGVIERKWIGIARVIGQPRIVAEGLLKGAYAWKLEIPLLVSYLRPPQYDTNSIRVDPLVIRILVRRQPVLQSDRGIGIEQIVGEAANVPTAPQQISNVPTSN